MGFETRQMTHARSARYDLKYPYGIWNLVISVYREISASIFEVSLWDLKHFTGGMLEGAIGFEVSLWDLKLKVDTLQVDLATFEVSLWDLKPRQSRSILDLKKKFEVSLWDLKHKVPHF